MKKEDLLDKWNKLASKKIYINENFQISVGRLVFIGIGTLIISISQILAGAPPAAICALWGNTIFSLEKKEKEKKD